MKTTIITLESHDDLISVRDRMSWAKTPRILLVWPKYEKVSLRPVDLKVLQRHASSLGAQLGLVSRARRVREDARAVGIPVFESTKAAQRASWSPPVRRGFTRRAPRKDLREKRNQLPAWNEAESWRATPLVRVLSFSVGVLSVLLLVALFLPTARVILKPETDLQSITLPVIANPSAEAISITGTIPAREKRVILEGSQTLTATGEGVMPQAKARGIVVFRNLTQNAVTIPSGTVVQTANGVRFLTLEEGAVEAGVGKTLDLPIEAVEGGIAGNVESDTITIIEGRLGLSLAVTNPEPTEGGRERASVQASDADRARAKELLLKKLESQARERFFNEMGEGDILFDETISISRILAETYDPPPGAAGVTLTLTMQVEYSARYASASDLNELAALALNASLPAGFSVASDTISLEPVTNPSLTNGSMRWTMRAERQIVRRIDPMQVAQMILGLDRNSAQTTLAKNLPLVSAPEITLFPSWWRWLPMIPFQIEVVVD